MDSRTLFVLETVFTVIGTASGIAAAWFELRDRTQTDDGRRRTRRWYGNKWRTIRDSGVLALPERVIEGLLRAKAAIARFVGTTIGIFPLPGWILGLISVCVLLIGPLGSWIKFGWIGVAVFILVTHFLGVGLLLLSDHVRWLEVFVVWTRIFVLIGVLGTPILWLSILLEYSIITAMLGMLVLVPSCALCLSWSFGHMGTMIQGPKLKHVNRETGQLLGISMTASFFVTLCALAIGHLASPDSWVPQTIQMLFSNVLFDGFTMLATFAILTRAVGALRTYPILVAVVLDVLVAALFACASLWFGMLGTEKALSIKQVLYVLIAKSQEGRSIELGPYFWAMHTTFLPTLFYLTLILLCWVGKLIVLPVAKLLSKGEVVDKPHRLTAGVFILVGVVSLGLAKGLDLVEQANLDHLSAASAIREAD